MDDATDDDDTIPAGPFSTWLAGMRRAIDGEQEADVPCGSCTACCRSAQFVHIEPDEQGALARIPSELLFPAPRLPAGHVLLGYDEQGRCPMLVEDRCSIYEDRPRTCRTYDCRVFAAAGVAPDEEAQPDIAARVERWRFSYPAEQDRLEHEAVRAAARFVRERRADLPAEARPSTPVQLAVTAVRIYDVLLAEQAPGGAGRLRAQAGADTPGERVASRLGDDRRR